MPTKRPEISDEKIAGLLRMTGPRPGVPANRTSRVKAAVRARWRAESGVRSRRRTWAFAALAAAAALAVVLAWESRWRPEAPQAPARMARVEAVSGPASIRPASGGSAPHEKAAPSLDVRAGIEVPAGSALRTAGDGRLAIRLPSGGSLRLDVDTLIEVVSDRSLVLTAGAVYVDSGGPADRGPNVEVRTPAGSVRETGTQFEVRLVDATVRVRVREGLVTMDRPVGGLEVGSGRELEVDPDGRTRSRDLPVHGEEWAWIEAIAPMMEIEGRSLREFLDWMARERGLGIRFASGDLDAAASTIRLNGSIKSMTLDQALESVLLTCRMRHRIAGDLLVVESLDESPASS